MTRGTESLNAEELIVGRIFSDDYVFEVPEYQRPYAWTKVDAIQLVDDLLEALRRDDSDPYFLGSVVLVKAPGEARAQVIDGQQRMVTLTILLAVLRDLVEIDELKRDIHKLVESPEVVWDQKPAAPRLKLRPRDAEFFAQNVQAIGSTTCLSPVSDTSQTTDSQENIRNNALAIRERLSELDKVELQQLFTWIAGRTVLVVVSTKSLPSAYRIFSVMNSRGMPLSPSDIFKSEVIGALSNEDRTAAADKWESWEEALGREEFAALFLHIRAIKSQSRAAKGLLQEFREQVLDSYLPGDAHVFLTEVLEPYARASTRMQDLEFSGSDAWEEVKAWLKRLNQLDNDDWKPVALWALKEHPDDAEFLASFFRKLERIAASSLLRREYRSPRAQRYMDLLKQLVKENSLEVEAFSLTDDEKTQTLEALNGEIYKVKTVPRYVLLRLDEILSQSSGAHYSFPIISIEHVLPQNFKSDSDWANSFTPEDAKYWTHRLGNLLLLSRRKNSKAQNRSFSTKKESYFVDDQGVCNFALTSTVLSEEEWTPEIIKKRHEELIAKLSTEWELD